jgi:tetratricopeptide (TPR) repeat protein
MANTIRNRTKEKRLCCEAVNDILDCQLVNEKEIQFLVNKYRWLFKAVPYTPNGIAGDFHKLNGELKKLKFYLDFKPQAIEALELYNSKKNLDEPTLIEWLMKYEQLGRALNPILLNTMFCNMGILDDTYGKLLFEFPLFVGTVDFYPIINFVLLFDKHYYAIIEKYMTNKEEGVIFEDGHEYYEASNKTLIDFIATGLNMPIEEVFKNHKEPFEVKRLKHLVPFKAEQRIVSSATMQRAHDYFHEDEYHEAIMLYKELLVSRNDLHEAKAGLAISYFILEEYELAEKMAAQLDHWQYRDLITLITKFKASIEMGGLKDINSYEIADRFAEEAIEEEANAIDRDKWIKENEDLFKSISIQPSGLPSIANAHINGHFFSNIANFHRLYIRRKFESTILNEMSHYQATCYFIAKMDIVALDKILDCKEYADVEKPIFLNKLTEAFDIFKESGNTELNGTTGVCQSCKKGCPTVAFIGDNDTHYIEIMIETEKDRVKDIYECNNFKYDTFNKDLLGKRISLDCSEYKWNNNLGLDDDMPF